MSNTRKHTAPAAKDFSVKQRNTLIRRGIAIVGSTWLAAAGSKGLDFANGERGYILDDCGTQRIRAYADVVAIANSPA